MAVDAGAAEHFLQAGLDHVGDGALGLRAAEIHRHRGKAELLAAGLVLEHDIADLGAVAVADNEVVTPLDEVAELSAGAFDILKLLLVRALLSGAEERIAAKGDHG